MKKMHLTVKLATLRNRLARAAFGCLGVAVCVSAAAQHEAIENCRGAPTDAARIDCLEKALAGGNGDAASGQLDRSDAQSAAEDDGSDEGGKGQADAPAGRKGNAPLDRGAEQGTAAESIGARQVRSRQRTGSDLETATGLAVVEYTQVPYRRLQVTLKNGQVWRQLEGDTQRIRVNLRKNRTVDINESRLGGYQLRLNEMGRTIRVERIR